MDGKEKKRRCIVIKAYTLKELADIYCVTKYIMRQLIKRNNKEIGKRIGYYYQAQQVEVMFQKIKLPSNVELE
jgi:hypothetical protein